MCNHRVIPNHTHKFTRLAQAPAVHMHTCSLTCVCMYACTVPIAHTHARTHTHTHTDTHTDTHGHTRRHRHTHTHTHFYYSTDRGFPTLIAPLHLEYSFDGVLLDSIVLHVLSCS